MGRLKAAQIRKKKDFSLCKRNTAVSNRNDWNTLTGLNAAFHSDTEVLGKAHYLPTCRTHCQSLSNVGWLSWLFWNLHGGFGFHIKRTTNKPWTKALILQLVPGRHRSSCRTGIFLSLNEPKMCRNKIIENYWRFLLIISTVHLRRVMWLRINDLSVSRACEVWSNLNTHWT